MGVVLPGGPPKKVSRRESVWLADLETNGECIWDGIEGFRPNRPLTGTDFLSNSAGDVRPWVSGVNVTLLEAFDVGWLECFPREAADTVWPVFVASTERLSGSAKVKHDVDATTPRAYLHANWVDQIGHLQVNRSHLEAAQMFSVLPW